MFKKRCVNSFLLVILILLIFPLVSAQPPPTTSIVINVNTGVAIDYPKQTILEQNQAFNFHFHIFNISTGKRLDNTTTNCSFELFDNRGNHLIDTPLNFLDDEFEINVTGGNFSRLGDYHYLVDCITNNDGGFISQPIIVTVDGNELTESISMLYLILIFGVFGIFLLALWGAIVLPMKNPKGGLDEIVDVSILKYFKLGLMFLSYTLFMWVINLLLTLSNNFSILSQYNGFFTMMFVILRSFIWPLFAVMWVVFTILAWKDLQLIKLLERGIQPK